ncbi:type II secretion system protein [Sulfurimonas sp.]|uniref:pilus assembly FimT family protein n=1 Tax=Sulfurimonas sp. TaxID=2022749 RepID=UPI0019F9DDA8|nr:type II secretion system protein [Sulfurimonas sp.]MBE0514848.1 type II secretion system protein [Sulfurimonas sp.]
MKKAFTMLELVFVIVVIGILAAVIIPRIGSNKLQEAAIQVVSHIRYTQHLALVNDRLNTADSEWYKDRWQIFFASTDGSEGAWAYSIFSDNAGDSTGNPDFVEIAKNPLNSSKYLTGGYSYILYSDSRVTKELNIGKKYGITNVAFSTSCSVSGSTRIAFDHLGRPLRGAFHNYSSAYPATDRLVNSQCTITLTDGSDNVAIAIEPETGYACVLNSAGTGCI